MWIGVYMKGAYGQSGETSGWNLTWLDHIAIYPSVYRTRSQLSTGHFPRRTNSDVIENKLYSKVCLFRLVSHRWGSESTFFKISGLTSSLLFFAIAMLIRGLIVFISAVCRLFFPSQGFVVSAQLSVCLGHALFRPLLSVSLYVGTREIYKRKQ